MVNWHKHCRGIWDIVTDSRIVDVDKSAMQVIGGSHHHAQLTFRDSTATENNVLVQTVDNAADYGDPPVALEMRAGQISLHSDWILHGSEPNGSNPRRCGLAMRYLPPTCTPTTAGTPTPSGAAAPTPATTGPTTPRPDGELIPREEDP